MKSLHTQSHTYKRTNTVVWQSTICTPPLESEQKKKENSLSWRVYYNHFLTCFIFKSTLQQLAVTSFKKTKCYHFFSYQTLVVFQIGEMHIRCKRLYAEQEEEIAMLKWKKFCTSWMTIMTISSLYSFLHDHPDDEGTEEDEMLPNLLPS